MNRDFPLNTIYLTISSVKHLLDEIQSGKVDKKTLSKTVDLLIRLLCGVFVANFESENENITVLAEYFVTTVLPKLRAQQAQKNEYPVTVAIKAVPRRRADGRLGLAATDISAAHILSMYRNYRPELVQA